jgi:predicted kinase
VTVGLPARGKTYMSHRLCRYLRWLGIPSRIFSVGDYRRRIAGCKPHDWFNSQESAQERLDIANEALEDLIKWVRTQGGQVGIYDASNTEPQRRAQIKQKLESVNIHVFISSY